MAEAEQMEVLSTPDVGLDEKSVKRMSNYCPFMQHKCIEWKCKFWYADECLIYITAQKINRSEALDNTY